MPIFDPTTLREDYLARLVATRFVPGRFKGRRALEREAEQGRRTLERGGETWTQRGLVALARLEVMLGLADKSAVTDAYEAVADAWLEKTKTEVLLQPRDYYWPPKFQKVHRFSKIPYGKRLPVIFGMVARKEWDAPIHAVPPAVVWDIQRKQHERKLLKDVAGPKEPVIVRFLQDKLKTAEWRTNIRTGYPHTRNVKLVPMGEERVASSVSYYLRKPRYRWANAASKHEWYVSHAMLSPETRELQKQNRKRVYLTPEKRVRAGRGYALVTEVLNKTRKRPRWIVQG